MSTEKSETEVANLAHLAKAEEELSELIKKKKQLDQDLATIENNLYKLEETYLTGFYY